jgi:hypothetical protein
MSEDNGTNGVRISMRDVYNEVQRQGKILERIANSLPDTDERVEDHEARLRKLETRMGWIWGGLGLLGALLGVFSVSLGG